MSIAVVMDILVGKVDTIRGNGLLYIVFSWPFPSSTPAVIIALISAPSIVFFRIIPAIKNSGCVKAPLICPSCVEYAATYSDLTKSCETTGRKIAMYRDREESNNKELVKLKGVQSYLCNNMSYDPWSFTKIFIKSDCSFDDYEDEYSEDAKDFQKLQGPDSEIGTKEELDQDTDTGKVYNREISLLGSEFQERFYQPPFSSQRSLKPRNIHVNALDTKYKCDICSFTTRYKNSLENHLLIHKDSSEVTIFQCDICTYTTRYKQNLTSHSHTHKEGTDLVRYKCETCRYETNNKYYFNKHLQVHEVGPRNEDVYLTRLKNLLKRHLVIHKSCSETEIYECGECNFRSKHKDSYSRHILKHGDKSKVAMFGCQLCCYKTTRKYVLKKHVLIHLKTVEGAEPFEGYLVKYLVNG
ncbi:hypothetical protein NQ317_011806, partial [Molorchus minor]